MARQHGVRKGRVNWYRLDVASRWGYFAPPGEDVYYVRPLRPQAAVNAACGLERQCPAIVPEVGRDSGLDMSTELDLRYID